MSDDAAILAIIIISWVYVTICWATMEWMWDNPQHAVVQFLRGVFLGIRSVLSYPHRRMKR